MPKLPQESGEPSPKHGSAGFRAREYEAVAVTECPCFCQDLDCPIGERNAVFSIRLHAFGRNRPGAGGQVEFLPCGTRDFSGPSCRKDHELER